MTILEFDEPQYLGLEKVISGGQTGADQAGLEAAHVYGIPTGGYAPPNFKTCVGFKKDYLEGYGLVECITGGYRKRTGLNVEHSSGTVRLASNFFSPGEILTKKFIDQFQKPYFDISIAGDSIKLNATHAANLVDWIITNKITVLNVAGNKDAIPSSGFGHHYHEAFNILTRSFDILKKRGLLCTSKCHAPEQ